MIFVQLEKWLVFIEKVKLGVIMKQKINAIIAILCAICIFAIIQMSGGDKKDTNKKEPAKTEQTTKESSTSTSSSSSTQEVKNDGPEYTNESNTQFVTHLTTEINNQLSSSGYQVTATPVGNNVVYIYVPQGIKYTSKAEIQTVADSLYSIKENTFKNWAIDNGYDLGFTNSPDLYVKSEDDTTLAEESGIVNKSMKVKINN